MFLNQKQFSIGLLFKNEEKTFPALKSFEKDKNLYEYRDRMRGYLGLPRRRNSINKSCKI